MYLKSLDIHGFKSFADKTHISFDEGITAIVGPNGCGKSNVVDAIRWVLGETSAKALRGGEMADVIFNGTEKRKPHGMAEVTLTMSECEEALGVDYNEVAITRRVFKDGKSEYRINNTICRLRDINDLFMDTGIGRTAYSIMEQGKIDMLLSSKPEDRRQVFEEAAGITKFKKEKKEAIRKLDYTQANLLRVSDVLAEQERRMNSLKRQVAKARRYKALATDVKILDTHLSHKKYKELSAELEELRTSMRSLEVREHEIEQELPAREVKVEEVRLQARLLEEELTEIRQLLNEKRNIASAAESRIAFNNEREAELLGRIQQNEADIKETQEKLLQQESDLEQATQSVSDLSQRIETQENDILGHEERVAVAKSEREECETRLRESRTQYSSTQSLIASSQARIESALSQQEGNRERARQLQDDKEKLKIEQEQALSDKQKAASKLEERQSNLIALEETLVLAEKTFASNRGEQEALVQKANETHKQLAKSASRLEVLQQLAASGEGFQQGTQAVLNGLDDPDLYKNAVRGVLANFIQVESEYTVAVEAALGTHLQAVLVSNTMLAETIIETLTEKKLGAAAIIPEDFISTSTPFQQEVLPGGAIAWALDYVKSDKIVAPVITQLLEKVVIVADLATALKLKKQYSDLTFTSKLGAVLSADGVITGGMTAEGSDSVLARQNEIRELDNVTRQLAEVEDKLKSQLGLLETSLLESRDETEKAREALQQARVQESTLQGELSLASREVESIEGKISSVEWECKDLDERESHVLGNREEMEMELQSARVRLEELDMEQLQLSRELEELVNREHQVSEVLHELRTNLAVERRAMQSAEEQKQPMAARLDELRSMTSRRESEIITFRERVESALGENTGLLEQIEVNTIAANELELQLEEKAASRSAIMEAINEAEAELAEIRKQVSLVTDKKGKEEVSATKIELRLENVSETVLERYQIDLSQFRPNSHELLGCIHDRKNNKRRVVSEIDEEGVAEQKAEASIETEVEFPSEDGPDWSYVESAVVELKHKLDSMGPVNVDAIEEYEELEERHNFVRSQHDDLVNAREELIGVIERINEETQKRFTETFTQVAKNFREMFKLLFGEKGKADLILVDEDDPLESGIEVIAKPPGKKLQSITLLSGGERAMTAVALLFSIYQIKPSPFCVLDELDAPLDEANIGRFLKVLNKFVDKSQFIIVTHHKRTMNAADIMYGVTMEEFGVSKPVGMRMREHSEVEALKQGEARTAAQKAALKLDSE